MNKDLLEPFERMDKVINIIQSCVTIKQLNNCRNYVQLFIDNHVSINDYHTRFELARRFYIQKCKILESVE